MGRAVRACRSGSAAVEFALMVPLFIGLSLTGTEIAYMASVQLQISQIAVSLSDNASRLGQSDNSSVTPTVTEADVNSILLGAMKQGSSLNLQANGRIILSSLEYDDFTGRQWFHWQRCKGNLVRSSAYGPQGAGLDGTTIAGVGMGTTKITAISGSAVMVGEIYYQYKGLMGTYVVNQPIIRSEAAFLNRDDRNLGSRDTNGLSPNATASSC
ncbi:MAG: pilus assembly protein TadE [Novosphingobium sp.]